MAFEWFRGSEGRTPSLEAYFKDPGVAAWLTVHGEESQSPLAAVNAWGRRQGSRLLAALPASVVRILADLGRTT